MGKNTYVADFETTTKVDDCRVWMWGLYDLNNNKFSYGKDIDNFFDNVSKLPDKSTIYFHNLAFDGEFIFYYLFEKKGFTHTLERKLEDYEFSSLITRMGLFYSINVRINNKTFHFYDSYKIIPLAVSNISEAFDITQLKGEIDYVKERPIGYIADSNEIDYGKNDVEIVGKGLTKVFNQNLNKMTQASNAFWDFKKGLGKKNFERLFPLLNDIDAELRTSYKGGFTYCNPKYQGKTMGKGIVLDVNSLYPSVMYNSFLPYGEPILFEGQYKEDLVYNVYIQMIRCNFELKEGYLPTIQLKNSGFGFLPTDYVTSSDGQDITICMTNVDLELFMAHYNVYNIEYFTGWKFKSSNTIFRSYIDKWASVKEEATITGNEGLRFIAKRMLVSLYGKFGTKRKIQSNIPVYGEYLNKEGKLCGEPGIVKYVEGEEELRDSIYLPVASFVTAYGRQKTISCAQKNYDTFMYADTDSLHLNTSEPPDNIDVDPIKLGYWKLEGNFNKAKFLRAKSYIEIMCITPEKWEKIKLKKQVNWKFNPSENMYEQSHVACAGLPTSCHKYITFENFKDGVKIPGGLKRKRVKGGVVLLPFDFTIKL